MGIVSKIFGSEKLVDSITGGADKAFFTTQEKAKWYLKYLEASAPQNIARRWIAVMVTGIWAFTCLTCVVLTMFGVPTAKPVFDVLTGAITVPFSIVIGFYFAKGILSGFNTKEKK
jgi:hypothetical protein